MLEEPSKFTRNARITRPQNITSFTPLPTDIMTEFLNNMSCLDLQKLKTSNTAFSKFITADIIAKVYKIAIDPNQPELQFYNEILTINNPYSVAKFDKQFPKYKGRINKTIKDKYELDKTLKSLIVDLFNDYTFEIPEDITKGDVIIVNFNGYKHEWDQKKIIHRS